MLSRGRRVMAHQVQPIHHDSFTQCEVMAVRAQSRSVPTDHLLRNTQGFHKAPNASIMPWTATYWSRDERMGDRMKWQEVKAVCCSLLDLLAASHPKGSTSCFQKNTQAVAFSGLSQRQPLHVADGLQTRGLCHRLGALLHKERHTKTNKMNLAALTKPRGLMYLVLMWR